MVVEGATDLGRLTVAVKALKTLVTVRRARISLSGARVN
jgi:glutamate dehydrogenase